MAIQEPKQEPVGDFERALLRDGDAGWPVTPDLRQALDFEGALGDAFKAPEEREIGFAEGVTKTATGETKALWDYLPFVGTVREAGRWKDLLDIARRADAGEATDEEKQTLLEAVQYMKRPMSAWGVAGTIVGEGPAFMGEMAVGGAGAAKVAGKVGLKALEKGLVEVAEDVAARKVGGALLKAGLEGAAIAAVNEGLTGGGHTRANVYRRMFQSMGAELSETEAGDLQVEFLGSAREFMDVLPAALLDTLIEPISERSGGALVAPLAKVQGAMASVAGQWMKKTGKGLPAFRQALQRAGWNGILGEFLEERYGGALRAAAGQALPEDFGGWEEVFPGSTQMAGELLGFGLMGGALKGAEAALGAGKPRAGAQEPEEGLSAEERAGLGSEVPGAERGPDVVREEQAGAETRLKQPGDTLASEGPGLGATQPEPDEQEAPAVSPETPEEAAEAFRVRRDAEAFQEAAESTQPPEASKPAQEPGAQQAPPEAAEAEPFDPAPLARSEGRAPEDYAEVPESDWTPEQHAAQRLASTLSPAPLPMRVVSGMRNEGAFVRPGEILVSAEAEDPARVVAAHEAAHDFVARSGGTERGNWIDTYRAIRREDPVGARLARAKHRGRWLKAQGLADDAEGRAAYRQAHPRGVMAEEAFSTYAGDVTAYLEFLTSPEGRRHMARAARRSPGLWQRIKDWIRGLWERVTGRSDWEEVQRQHAVDLPEGPRREAAVASSMLAEAMRGAREVGPEAAPAEVRFAPPAEEGEEGPLAPRMTRPTGMGQVTERETQQFHEDRARALAGEILGRPDLAVTMPEQKLAAIQAAVDEMRNRRGLPEPVAMGAVQEAAQTAAMADPDGTARALVRKIKSGETLSAAEVFAMRYLNVAMSKRALNVEDELGWTDAILFNHAYRQSGSEQARAFVARQTRYNREMSGQELMALLLARPTIRTDRKIKRLLRRRTTATDARQKEIDAEIERLLGQEARKNRRVGRALRREGIDPATVTTYDWQDPAVASRLIRAISTARASTEEKLREWLYAAVLSWIYTHERNWRGNFINLGVSKYVQETIEGLVNLAVRDPNSPQAGEIKVVLANLWPSIKEFGRRFVDTYRYEQIAMDGQPMDKLIGEGLGGPAIRSPLFKPLRGISLTLLRAVDNAFKGHIEVVTIAQLAYREAQKEGLKGDALGKRMRELMMDPGVVERATQKGLELTFQDQAEEGTLTAWAENTAFKLREAADETMPFLGTLPFLFVKTPLRLIREAGRRTPVAWIPYVARLAKTVKARSYPGRNDMSGAQAFVHDTTDAIIAAGLLAAVLSMIDDEDEMGLPVLGGTPDPDYAQRNLQYRTRGPWTIKAGGMEFNYKQTDPIALALGATVDAARAWRNGGGGARGLDDLGRAAAAAVVSGMRDATYLRTVGDVHKLAEGHKNIMDFGLSTFVTPWMPNIVKGALREMDPYARESRAREYDDMGKNEAAVRRLPYRLLPSEHLAPPPKYDVWGRPLERTPITWNNGVLLERSLSSGDPNRIDAMLWKWNQMVERGETDLDAGEKKWAPSAPRTYTTKGGGRTNWTDEEYERYVRDSGRAAAERLLGMRLNWDQPTWRDIETVKRVLSRERERVRDRLLRERARQGAR